MTGHILFLYRKHKVMKAGIQLTLGWILVHKYSNLETQSQQFSRISLVILDCGKSILTITGWERGKEYRRQEMLLKEDVSLTGM